METFSNSNMRTHTRISPNKSCPRGSSISKITIHHVAGVMTVESIGNWFATTSTKASSNYGVDSDGHIGLYVEEKDRAWTSSNSANDNVAVTIEVSNNAIGGNWPISDKALQATIDLCVDICRRNGIPALIYTGDAAGTLTLHKFFTATVCPGRYLEGKMSTIATTVTNRLVDCLNLETEVKAAALKLQSKGITCSYLYENFHIIKDLGHLIIKLGNTPIVAGINKNITTVATAITYLQEKHIIYDANYWLQNSGRVQFLDDLIIESAKVI